jgi:hypothetical protein
VNGIDELVTASLRERAAAGVDTAALLAAATERGRARRRRRRFIGIIAAGAVIAGAFTVAARPDDPSRSPFVGSGPGRAVPLPVAKGVPGARAQPGSVGTDPLLIHFDAPGLTNSAYYYTWSSGEGFEQLEAAYDGLVHVAIGPDMAVLDAVPRQDDGAFVVREQPVPGLWLRVSASTHEVAQHAATTIDLDRAQRCVLPFSLWNRPRDTRATMCYVGFGAQVYTQGGVLLRGLGGETMEVQAQYSRGFPDTRQSNHRAGDRPAFLYPGRDEVQLVGHPGLYLSVRIGKAYSGFTVADADAVLAEVRLAPDVERIETWPPTVAPG